MAPDVAELNYFTCTLGHAVLLKERSGDLASEPFKNALDLIQRQADRYPDSPAVGFAKFEHGGRADWLTFRQLDELSIQASQIVSKCMGHGRKPSNDGGEQIVALLCPSNMDFLLTWLGLMRLGYTVMFLAPQLEPHAIQHLYNELNVKHLFVHENLQTRVSTLYGSTSVLLVPSAWESSASNGAVPSSPPTSLPISANACICHTSGTSSGLPKAIFQSHAGVVGCLYPFPRESGESPPATFTTTPLYHGGLPDCFRSWSSGAMIWLFPEGYAPITGSNVISAIQSARSLDVAPIKYFSSVPFVLQMLLAEDDSRGVELLKTMDLVGFGGAALPSAAGDTLVHAGVNLLSRMGSAECGFIMSSHRDYSKDKDWEYLRPINDPRMLSFEAREGGLSELIVRDKWPFKTKTNSDDGRAYATADLFEPHPSIPYTWRYHSRADAQIALANGKKFDPSPMEADILAAISEERLLQDVLVFGSGRDYAGLLLFSTPGSCTSKSDLIDSVWDVVSHMNSWSQSHARISKSMLVVISPDKLNGQPLPKSSKGTILRNQAESLYAREIESAYVRPSPTHSSEQLSNHELRSRVLDCFHQVLGRHVEADRDLYQQGVDSIACVQIRNLLEATCLDQAQQGLPLNVIYDQRTVAGLVDYLAHLRCGDGAENNDKQNETHLNTMRNIVKKYGDFRPSNPVPLPRKKQDNVIVLTGATGFLGAHILHLLRQDVHVDKVYCLVRAETAQGAKQRVSQALASYNRPVLEATGDLAGLECEVVCLSCDLTRRDLGLSDEDVRRILDEATVVIHSAWAVNFNLPLASFEDQIIGTRHLLDVAAEADAKFYFISSTAAVSASPARVVPETLSQDPSEASSLGYSQSKWIAENICAAANTPAGSRRVAIIRVGQLCGNETGAWNTREAYPLMLSTAQIIECLPDLSDTEVVNWMPVQLAAQSVLDIVTSYSDAPSQINSQTAVYHVLNYHDTPVWRTMLQWLNLVDKGLHFDIVSPSEWIELLGKALKEEEHSRHPSHALIGLWKGSLAAKKPIKSTGGAPDKSSSPVVYDKSQSSEASPTMRKMEPLTVEELAKMWVWIHRNIG